MKKNKVLFIGLLMVPLLSACNMTIITPSRSFPGDIVENKETFNETNMTVNFYVDYSRSDDSIEPIYSVRWYMLKPLSEEIKNNAYAAIEACKVSTDPMKKPDPLYPKFLGFSEYSSSLDDSKLWKWETEYKQSNILKLYGIWVSEEGVNE